MYGNRRALLERYYSFRSDDAVSTNSDGSSFTVGFGHADPAWQRVQKVKLSAVRSTIWWTVPNVQATSIYLYFQRTSSDTFGNSLAAVYSVEVKIPKGLYGYNALNSLIDTALVNQNIPKGTFSLYADYATQKINLRFKWAGHVRFGSSELATILGFYRPPLNSLSPTDPQRAQSVDLGEAPEWTSASTIYEALTIPAGTGYSSLIAPYHARFDHIQYFNVQSSLADGGLFGNSGVAQNIIAQVLIDRQVGEQIVYDPNIPIQVDTTAFTNGNWPSSATFTLLDDKFRSCDTNGQPWTITIRLQEVYSDIDVSTGLQIK